MTSSSSPPGGNLPSANIFSSSWIFWNELAFFTIFSNLALSFSSNFGCAFLDVPLTPVDANPLDRVLEILCASSVGSSYVPKSSLARVRSASRTLA